MTTLRVPPEVRAEFDRWLDDYEAAWKEELRRQIVAPQPVAVVVNANPKGCNQHTGPGCAFHGWQKRPGMEPLAFYNLTEDQPGHPKGSTVTQTTLKKLGLAVPETPPPPAGYLPKPVATITSAYPPLKVSPGGVREMPTRDHPSVKLVSPGEVDALSKLSGTDVPVPIHTVAKGLGWDPDRTGYVLRRAMADGRVSGRIAEMTTGDPDELAFTYKNAEGELIGRVVRK